MATVASQVAVPSPADSYFQNGEFAVAVSASPGSMVTRHFAKFIFAERSGVYLFNLWVKGGGSLKTGSDLSSLEEVLVAPPNETIRVQLYLRKGENRIDLSASSDELAFFAMTIYQPDLIFYASGASGWVFDASAPPDDVDVPASSQAAIPVFTVLPNWSDGIIERLSYLTDILTSETSNEQTRLLRFHPRRQFDANFLRNGSSRIRLENFLIGSSRRKFWMPLWHEQYSIMEPLGPAVSYVQFPAGSLALREFQVGDSVFLNAGDPDVYEVLSVASLDYDLDRLHLSSNADASWPVGSRVIPMRRATIIEQTQVQGRTDSVATTSIRFELADPEYRFGASWAHCAPVWRFKINRAEDVGFTYDHLTYVMDNQVAPAEYMTPSKRVLGAMRFSILLRGRSNIVDFRRFIDMAGGRAARFYMPTEMQALELVGGGVSGVTIDAKAQGFTDYIEFSQESRGILGFFFADGSEPVYRNVVDVQKFDQVERFTLNEALPAISKFALKRVQYMVPSRFDQDTFELNHLVDSSAAVRATLVTRWVSSIGMADINCP